LRTVLKITKAQARVVARQRELPPCDKELYLHGEHLFTVYSGVSSYSLERWVKKAAKQSGQRLDWWTCGGRDLIVCIGDRDLAKAVVESLAPARAVYRWVGDSTSVMPHPVDLGWVNAE